MRRAARKDRNHNEIAAVFAKMGCAVLDISQLKNCGDMVVCRGAVCVIVEVKDGDLVASARKLSKGESIFRENWTGLYTVVKNIQEAVDVANELRNRMNGLKAV